MANPRAVDIIVKVRSQDDGKHEKNQTHRIVHVSVLDDVVIEFNRQAYEKLQAEKHLAIVPGATHLFEEPGTLQEVARLAAGWFRQYLDRDRAQEERLGPPPKSAIS